MPLTRRRRRLLLIPGGIFTLIIVLLVSLPLWFPWVLAPAARNAGVSFSNYRREGYGRFALDGLVFTNRSLRFSANRAEAPLPTAWLGSVLIAQGKTAKSFILVQDWHLDTVASTRRGPVKSSYTNLLNASAVLGTLNRWVPGATLSNGTIRVQQTIIKLPKLTWSQGLLQGDVEVPKFRQQARLDADLRDTQSYFLNVYSDPHRLRSMIWVSRDGSGFLIRSTNSWWSNRFELDARFSTRGILPEKASLTAQHFSFPVQLTYLSGYRSIDGSVEFQWKNGEFATKVDATARPLTNGNHSPPFQISLHAHGDTNYAAITSAVVTSPGLKANLSQNLKVRFSPPFLPETANLSFVGDLSQVPWLQMKGQIEGDVEFRPSEKFPVAQIHLSGTEIHYARIQTESLKLDAALDWPWLNVSLVDTKFEDGTIIKGRGNLELEKMFLRDGHIQCTGRLGNQWMPAGYGYENLFLTADFLGSVTNLFHEGRLTVTNFIGPQLSPLQLSARWKGQQASLAHAQLELLTGPSSLQLDGSLQADAHGKNVLLNTFTLLTNAEPILKLIQPLRIIVNGNSFSRGWQLSTSALNLAGKGGEFRGQARVNWPTDGWIQISAKTPLLSGSPVFTQFGLKSIQVHKFQAAGGWTNGPAIFHADLSAGATLAQRISLPASQTLGTNREILAGPLSLDLNLAGDKTGVTVSNLVLNSEQAPVIVGHGYLPAIIVPGSGTKTLELQSDRPLDLALTTIPATGLWQRLSAHLGIGLTEPKMDLRINGTWREPAGRMRLRVAKIDLRERNKAMPSLEKLVIDLDLSHREAHLTTGSALLQGQLISVTGKLPLEETAWSAIKEKKLPDLSTMTGRLRIEKADLAAVAELFPALLTPQGMLDLDLTILPGWSLGGGFRIEKATTRPLATLGPIRDINVKVEAKGRIMELEDAIANVGGSLINMKGELDLRGTNWFSKGIPPFILALRGTNVPLSRQPESVIRSDLNLAVTKTNGAPALISGSARLRDSFYFSDLSALIPGKIASPSRRPPYFSIDKPPFADWRLSVKVLGERFLRVRSTVFNGEVTANLRIQGTLRDPLALGDAKIDAGTVRFPFASLELQQGLITLTSEDPYHPSVSITAGSRQYGYDLKMQVTGPVDRPVIQFTSNPPLASDQILLLVTAGELPRGGFELTPQQRAQTLALFVGKDLLAKFGFGDSSEQRLTIHSGEQITESGRPTYSIEYRLSPHWALEGEYDRFGDYNAGLKWNIYSK